MLKSSGRFVEIVSFAVDLLEPGDIVILPRAAF